MVVSMLALTPSLRRLGTSGLAEGPYSVPHVVDHQSTRRPPTTAKDATMPVEASVTHHGDTQGLEGIE